MEEKNVRQPEELSDGQLEMTSGGGGSDEDRRRTVVCLKCGCFIQASDPSYPLCPVCDRKGPAVL